MSVAEHPVFPVARADRFFIGGEWVAASSDARIDVIDPGTEQLYFRVAEAKAADMHRAIGAARCAFDDGPWPTMTHSQRAEYMVALASELRRRTDDLAQIWPRESGVLHKEATHLADTVADKLEFHAAMATTFPFEEEIKPSAGAYGLLRREPVGVVGAIIPWNGPLGLIANKISPAMLAGCTLVVKVSPEAPGEAYVLAEAAEAIGLPPGVINVLTADRQVSELLVTDHRVDKITFTGSTLAGRRIGSLCGDRIARCTLELGGKSAAIVLDDADIDHTASLLAAAECHLTGQYCSSLTRIIIGRDRHDQFVEALASKFAAVRVGNQFDPESDMGPLAAQRHRDRVEGYIAKGVEEGATLVTGGRRPAHLTRGWFVEPTVFANVDNSSTIAQDEIFGPVVTVIPASDQRHAVQLANDTIYGLNNSVFTNNADHAYEVARQLRSGTVGHNAFRSDFGVAFGGYKQSGIGREGGTEGVYPYLETKFIILDSKPTTVAVGTASR